MNRNGRSIQWFAEWLKGISVKLLIAFWCTHFVFAMGEMTHNLTWSHPQRGQLQVVFRQNSDPHKVSRRILEVVVGTEILFSDPSVLRSEDGAHMLSQLGEIRRKFFEGITKNAVASARQVTRQE